MKLLCWSYLLCFVFFLSACRHSKENEQTSEEDRLVKVEAEAIQATRELIELHYSGTVEPSQTIPLSFQSTGIVDNVFVQEGDLVKKGQILATVNKADNESLSRASVAKYNQAKDAYDRLKSVYEKGSLSEIKWVEIETNLKQAEAQMQITQSNLGKCYLRSPENGIIGKRNIEPGQSSLLVNAPIELVKIETVLVKIAVAENEISKIKKGQKVTFSISALDGKSFEGIVTSIGVVADKISRTYEVKVTVENTDLDIKPGMVCDVNLHTQIEKGILMIPNVAVSKDSEAKTYVYVVSSDKKRVKKQYVILGNYCNNGIEVKSGLNLGDLVVILGVEKLSDNSLISFLL